MHSGPQLVDHLLVELADPPAGRTRIAGDEDSEQPSIGDRPARGDGHDAGVAPALDDPGHPVPHDPGLELRELVRRVGPREHREDPFERLS